MQGDFDEHMRHRNRLIADFHAIKRNMENVLMQYRSGNRKAQQVLDESRIVFVTERQFGFNRKNVAAALAIGDKNDCIDADLFETPLLKEFS